MKIYLKKWIKKFFSAIHGIFICIKEEKSFQIELFISCVSIFLGIIFKIATIDWVLLFVLIAIVLAFELINSGFENLLDLVSFKYDVKIKKIKDLFAGAVLLISIFAFGAGLWIFIPAIINFFK